MQLAKQDQLAEFQSFLKTSVFSSLGATAIKKLLTMNTSRVVQIWHVARDIVLKKWLVV